MIKSRHLGRVALLSFTLTLLFSGAFIQVGAQTFTETRRTALVERLVGDQLDWGGFHTYSDYRIAKYVHVVSVEVALTTLGVLDSLDRVDVGKALDYVASKQLENGGFYAFYDGDGTLLSYDLEVTYDAVELLSTFNSLELANRTALVSFAVARYNDTVGAFHELVVRVYNKSFAMCGFGLSYGGEFFFVAYAIPNVISTFLGAGVLSRLGELNLINVSKVTDWVLSCWSGESGGFRPFPEAQHTPLPGWSSLVTNPFKVDRYGTGLPYTYAAVMALKNLGQLNRLSAEDRARITQYVVSCWDPGSGDFEIHMDSTTDSDSTYTYYAVMTLAELGTLGEARAVIGRVVDLRMSRQELSLENPWLTIPPQPGKDYYGLFVGHTDPLGEAFYTVSILNATGELWLLNQLTPRVLQTSLNILLLSALVASYCVLIASLSAWARREIRAEGEKWRPLDERGSSTRGGSP